RESGGPARAPFPTDDPRDQKKSEREAGMTARRSNIAQRLRPPARISGCLASLALLASCALPPSIVVDPAGPGPSARTAVAPAASDGRRALADRESAAVVKRIPRRTSSELLAGHLAFVEQHVERPLVV